MKYAKKAQVSKPGLYCEFNNEEGLMIAALSCCEEKVLKPMFEMLTLNMPFIETLNHIADFATMQDDTCKPSSGCLMVKMRQSRMHLTSGAQEKIDDIQAWVLMAYQEWIERSKEKGGGLRAACPPHWLQVILIHKYTLPWHNLPKVRQILL